MTIISISSHPLIPLSAQYAYDDKLGLAPVYFEDANTGYYGINNPAFDNIKDVKTINNSLFYITSAMNLGDFFVESTESINVFDMAVFTSMELSGKYFTISGSEILGVDTNVNNRALFRVDRNVDGTYSFIDSNEKYWTVELIYPWNITLETKLLSDTYNQQTFNIEFSGSSVFIKSKVSNTNYPPFLPEYYEHFIGINKVTGRVGANGFILLDKNEFKINWSEYTNSTFEKGYVPDSAFVKYYNEFEDLTHNKDLEFESVIRNTKQNYLIDCPYKTKLEGETLPVNIANLKNIHTPEYEYIKAPYFVNDTITEITSANVTSAIKRRDYNKLFMGSNQERGYILPCLGFNSDTKELLFKTDTVTYFHYPKTAPLNVPIQYIGFIESGAVPGNTPARSDKIWKKLADYEKNIWWGNSTHSAVSPTSSVLLPIQQGTWLCSWLSGDNTNSVWMDRWYYPGYASLYNALTLDTTFIENTGAKVWDEPTQMTMDGGCWYKYFHFGNNENKKIVTALEGNSGVDLRVNYQTWDSNIVTDESIYENNGIIQNYNDNIVYNNSLSLNGNNQYCLVPYNSSYKLTDKISVLTRVKTKDWESVKGNHIISNGINNGWNIKFTNGYFNPVIPVYETTYGHILFLNSDTNMYQDTLFPVSSHPISGNFYGTPAAITMDNNLNVWVTNNDDNRKRLYKLNYEGTIDSEIIFNSNVSLDWLTVDQNNNIWVLDTISNNTSGFYTDTTYFSSVQFTSLSGGLNRIDFDTNNILLSADYNVLDRCIDKDNNVYDLVIGASYITKNGANFYNSKGVTNIACDKNGKLWVLKNGNVVTKITSTGHDDVTCTVGDFNTASRKIFFTNEYDGSSYNEFVWVFQQTNNKLYKLTNDCVLVKSINLEDSIDVLNARFVNQDRNLMIFDIKGDNTAYNWQTKFADHTPRIETEINFNSLLVSNITLNYPISSFVNNEFYYFAFTYDKTNSQAKFYVNDTLMDSSSSGTDNAIYYKNNNSMVVGGTMGNRNVFNDDLNSTYYTLEGEIDTLQIYDSLLNTYDIKHIEMLDFNFKDLKWNMPIGIQSFVEEIERFFKHKLPGLKSHYYNITLSNLNITNSDTRALIEEIIRDTVKKITPVHTELYKIIWE